MLATEPEGAPLKRRQRLVATAAGSMTLRRLMAAERAGVASANASFVDRR